MERERDGHCPSCQLILSSLRLLGDDDSDDGIESTLGLDRPDQDGETMCQSLLLLGNSARGTSCDASLDQANCVASSTPRANESFVLRCGPVDLVFLRLEPSGTTAAFHLQRRGLPGPQTLGAPPPRALC